MVERLEKIFGDQSREFRAARIILDRLVLRIGSFASSELLLYNAERLKELDGQRVPPIDYDDLLIKTSRGGYIGEWGTTPKVVTLNTRWSMTREGEVFYRKYYLGTPKIEIAGIAD